MPLPNLIISERLRAINIALHLHDSWEINLFRNFICNDTIHFVLLFLSLNLFSLTLILSNFLEIYEHLSTIDEIIDDRMMLLCIILSSIISSIYVLYAEWFYFFKSWRLLSKAENLSIN